MISTKLKIKVLLSDPQPQFFIKNVTKETWLAYNQYDIGRREGADEPAVMHSIYMHASL